MAKTNHIVELLGKDADNLLNYKAKGFPADALHLPGPDFVDRVVAEYPDLGNKLMLVSTLGADNLARLITNAIRKPPRILPG